MTNPQRCGSPLVYSANAPMNNASKRHLRLRALTLYHRGRSKREDIMAWTTPVLVEICVGLEINGYLPPEF